MKLNKKGWGYKTFIILICILSSFLLIANHYLTILIETSEVNEIGE